MAIHIAPGPEGEPLALPRGFRDRTDLFLDMIEALGAAHDTMLMHTPGRGCDLTATRGFKRVVDVLDRLVKAGLESRGKEGL